MKQLTKEQSEAVFGGFKSEPYEAQRSRRNCGTCHSPLREIGGDDDESPIVVQ